jgi:hypothetical protein
VEFNNCGFYESLLQSGSVSKEDISKAASAFERYKKNLASITKTKLDSGSMLISAINQIGGEVLVDDDLHLDDIFEQGFFELQRERDEAHLQTSSQGYNGPIIGQEIVSPYHLIYDELDKIGMSSDKLVDGQTLRNIKRRIFHSLTLPSVSSHAQQVLPVPERMAVKNEIKAFCPFDHDALERALKLHKLEDMMKQDQKANELSWKFLRDRQFVIEMQRDTVLNSLASDLLLHPDLATHFDPINNSLLLALYFKNPPGRIIRKQWTYESRNFPELESFIRMGVKPSLEKTFLDIDGSKFGEIKHNEKSMLPSDDSVIHTSKIKFGNRSVGRSYVVKDNLTFGIREQKGKEHFGEDLLDSQYLDSVPNPSDLWVNLSEECKLLVEMRLQGKLQAHLKPSEEELQMDAGAQLTVSYRAGIQLKFLPSMDVVMHNSFRERGAETEQSRVVTRQGQVIRHFENGDMQILLHNGNVSSYSKKTHTWVKVNNNGETREVKMGSDIDSIETVKMLPRLVCEEKTDPETKCQIVIRSDKVMTVFYPEHTLVLHSDGTSILRSNDGSSTIIEKEGFPPVTIRKVRQNTVIGLGGSDALMGSD